MTENDLEQLSTFMGHTTDVHRKSYRLPNDVYQTAKISKLLMLTESGKGTQYKGKALNEIDVNMDENLLNADTDDSEFDENKRLPCIIDASTLPQHQPKTLRHRIGLKQLKKEL